MSIEIGTRFGRWETVGEIHGVLKGKTKPRVRPYVPCQCECGVIKDVSVESLNKGQSKGCTKCKDVFLKYGEKRNLKMYEVFANIKTRCTNKNYKQWDRYGGRGIECLWKEYGEFYSDMKDGYEEHLTIDRIDNDGDYCKGNCRWVDRSVQIANQSLRKTNTTGYIGVSPLRDIFQAVIYYKGETIRLGIFDNAKDAAVARDMEILERGFPHNLNFKYKGGHFVQQ